MDNQRLVSVRPVDGLPAGTYTARLQVTADQLAEPVYVELSFVVSVSTEMIYVDGQWFYYIDGVRLTAEGIFLVPNYWYPAQHGVPTIYKQFGPGGAVMGPAHGPFPSIGVFQDGQRLEGWISWPPGSNQVWHYATTTGFATGDTVLQNPWPDMLAPAVANEYIRLLFCNDGVLQGKAYGIFAGQFYWSGFTIDQLVNLLGVDMSNFIGWVYLGGLPHGLNVSQWIYVRADGSVAMGTSLLMPNPWPDLIDHAGNVRVFFNAQGFFTHYVTE